MHIGDFDFYKDFLYKQAGINLTANQSYLLVSRLTPVARKWNFKDLRAMTMALRSVPDVDMIYDVIEAMIDGDTEFFTDLDFFDRFREQILPQMVKAVPRRKLRIWCAGCSTGQEAFSLAMSAYEYMKTARCAGIQILATDISRSAIDRARKGRFTQNEIQHGMPTKLAMKYFTHEGRHWQVSHDIADMIRFEPFNLMHNMSALGEFDIIVCRYVLSRFDGKLASQILSGFAGSLGKKGLLITSPEETLPIPSSFKASDALPGCYAS